jgi:hypothetical protein
LRYWTQISVEAGVLTAMTMKNFVSWSIKGCILVKLLHLQDLRESQEINMSKQILFYPEDGGDILLRKAD